MRKIRNNILFNDLHFEVLIRCNYTYAHKVSKQLDATWTTVSTLIKELTILGLIKTIPQGKFNLIELTSYGKLLVKMYEEHLKPLRLIQEDYEKDETTNNQKKN